MIHGVRTKALRVIPDERGRLMGIFRSDEEVFIRFGQIYMTTAYPGVVKGWHYHKKEMDNFAVVKGMIKIVLYDRRENSPTRGEVNEFFLGEHNPHCPDSRACPPWIQVHRDPRGDCAELSERGLQPRGTRRIPHRSLQR
jgi:dTDP-4-dehydrorhamnose 3,5-epimerase